MHARSDGISGSVPDRERQEGILWEMAAKKLVGREFSF